MPQVAIYDACVLHPAPLRDLLLRIAQAGLVRARWTERILDECFESILRERPELRPAALSRTRRLMNEAVADCLVSGYDTLIADLRLPDSDDRHVLAAAIRAKARVIVTANLRDFPKDALAPHRIGARHPDDFVLGLLKVAPGAVVQIVTEQAAALRSPPRTVEDLMSTLRDVGLVRTVAKLRELRGTPTDAP